MSVSEIYQLIADKILQGISIENWTQATANIERLNGMVSFTGHYFSQDGQQSPLNSNFGFFDGQAIHRLYEITTEGKQNRWNLLRFILFPNGKFEMDFIWDQEYQDKIDALNRKH